MNKKYIPLRNYKSWWCWVQLFSAPWPKIGWIDKSLSGPAAASNSRGAAVCLGTSSRCSRCKIDSAKFSRKTAKYPDKKEMMLSSTWQETCSQKLQKFSFSWFLQIAATLPNIILHKTTEESPRFPPWRSKVKCTIIWSFCLNAHNVCSLKSIFLKTFKHFTMTGVKPFWQPWWQHRGRDSHFETDYLSPAWKCVDVLLSFHFWNRKK